MKSIELTNIDLEKQSLNLGGPTISQNRNEGVKFVVNSYQLHIFFENLEKMSQSKAFYDELSIVL